MDRRPQETSTTDSPTLIEGDSEATEVGATVIRPEGGCGADGPGEVLSLGRYENLGEIARGGMGVVYRVRDGQLDRELALKVVLFRDPGPELRRRFVEEARVSGRLQHPGIPPIHEIGELEDGRPYYTMKLIDGHTLAALFAGRPDLRHDLMRYVSIFESVCQTLGYAHARGVVHRDMKPENVMVGAFGEVQVMDWGLAKVLEPAGRPEPAAAGPGGDVARDGRSLAGDVMGTPAYMPPEQALGQVDRVDERSDVFALGAILCELLTGEPPFVDRPGDHAHRQAMRADLDAARKRLAGCGADDELVELARRCLQAEPTARPKDAEAVAEAVAAYQESMRDRLRAAEIARAEAVARAEIERKRRRLAVAYLSTVAAMIILGTAGVAYIAYQRSAHDAKVAGSAKAEILRAQSLSLRAESASTDDEAAWADAIATARGACDMLADEPGLEDLRRSAEATLADIERRREGCRSLVPRCLAASNRYRSDAPVPPQAVDHDDPGPGTPPDYSGISIMRRSIFFDLSGWKRLPTGADPATAGRVEPTNYTQVLDIVRKQNVTADNRRLVFAFLTEGFEFDLRCVNHPYTVRGPAAREALGGGTRPVLRRELVIDIAGCQPGKESRIVIQGTIWNGFQPDAAGKTWAGMLAADDLSEAELAVTFAGGRKPRTPPTLYVFPRGSARKEAPSLTQDFANPLDRDWWLWRPRDILRDSVYQIEWSWGEPT
ncbi:serine/threonine-protein kinase [Aquisphaera insulae]|uniref:serine/threonine-protein kinase n=1 Tax=Aquisphaera insulae TaxID=2712864 RepID=UPI0013E9E502|nr:serine/threonine-protein kinase [Aquisphaera insulae]